MFCEGFSDKWLKYKMMTADTTWLCSQCEFWPALTSCLYLLIVHIMIMEACVHMRLVQAKSRTGCTASSLWLCLVCHCSLPLHSPDLIGTAEVNPRAGEDGQSPLLARMLSKDHKPEDPEEIKRVESVGEPPSPSHTVSPLTHCAPCLCCSPRSCMAAVKKCQKWGSRWVGNCFGGFYYTGKKDPAPGRYVCVFAYFLQSTGRTKVVVHSRAAASQSDHSCYAQSDRRDDCITGKPINTFLTYF